MATPDKPVTNFPTPLNSTCNLLLGDASGYAIQASCTGTPPTTANFFQHGCLMYQTDTSTGSGAVYQNIGSIAIPSWSLLDTASASFELPVAATDSTTTTGTSFAMTQNAVTTGNGMTQSLNGLTTGKGHSITHTTSVISGGGTLLNLSSTGIDTTTTSGALLNLSSTASTAGTQVLLTASALTTGTAASVVVAALTTGVALGITANALTTGNAISIASSSADTGTRSIVKVANTSAASTGATLLELANTSPSAPYKSSVGLTSTHFMKQMTLGAVTLWTSDGTTANGALTGTAGDICFNAGSNKPEYCTGTTNWTALV